MTRYILHEDPTSMNCYKVRLVASITGHTLERKFYDILKGETRTPEFLRTVSPWGRIPVLEIVDNNDDNNDTQHSSFMPESNAACYYLADTSSSANTTNINLIPSDRFTRAQMMQWLFFEQNEHEPNIAGLRFWKSFVGFDALDATKTAQISVRQAAGSAVLHRMDDHLARSTSGWFVGAGVTLADLVLYAYTHVAREGGFELDEYPRILAWLGRVEGLKGYVPAFE